MTPENNSYRLLIENLPDAFAYHQVVLDDHGNPVDYIFIEINAAYEEMTGLKREMIIGKKVTEIIPGIEKSEFDWIGTYGRVALDSKPIRFDSFFEPLSRWYDVSAYSDKPGYFAAIFRDISKHKQNIEFSVDIAGRKQAEKDLQYQHDQMTLLLDVSKAIAAEKETVALAQVIVDGITKLTRLKSAAIYLLQGNRLYLQAACPPLPPDFPEPLRIAALEDHPHIGKAVSSKHPLVLEDSSNEILTEAEREVCEQRQLRSILYVPLAYQGEVIGVLIPASIEITHEFTEDEIKICQTMASHAALSLSEAILAEEKLNYIKEIEEKNKRLSLKEEALRESEEQFRQITENMIDVVWLRSADNSKMIYISPSYEQVWGRTCQSLIDNPQSFMDSVYSEDLEKVRAEFHRYLQWEQFNLEYRIERPGGELRWVRSRSYPVRNSSGDIIRHAGIAVDITERKLAEEEIRTLNEELEQRVKVRTAQLEASYRELDAFSYSVSHDLRGPLNRIGGFSQALLEDYASQLDQQGQDYLRRIGNSSRQMTELIDDLLKLSKVSRMEINHEPVEISALVNVCLKELQAREPQRNLEILITPGLIVEGDTTLLRIVLENLIDNAWKYTGQEEKATIEFGLTEQDGRSAYYIRDNGAGFDMKYASKLFTAFQRLHSEQEFSGTGIGLSIVSRIIKRHGGEIWAEGEPGKGACFYFTLP